MASMFDSVDNKLATPGTSGGPRGANPFMPTSPAGSGSQTPAAAGSSQSNPFAPSTGGFKNPFNPNGSDTENGFNTSGSGLINLGAVPNATAQPYEISPEIQAMLDGKGGFSPETLTSMNASAKESAANAGQQQMAQVKRQMAQNGVTGSPAAAGYAGAVAKQTGEQQQQNEQQVQQQDAAAKLAQQNMAAQIQAQAGEGNMQSANQLALSNAQMLYNALLSNQNAVLQTQRTVSGL